MGEATGKSMDCQLEYTITEKRTGGLRELAQVPLGGGGGVARFLVKVGENARRGGERGRILL